MTVSLHQYQSILGLAEACWVDGADHIDKDVRPEMFHLANADQSLMPAAHHRFFVGIKLMERRQDRLVEALGRSGLGSMRECAKEHIGMKDDVVLRDIRALAATDTARRGENRSDIQMRLVHTSGKTTDIYIKEVIADVSEIPMALPWLE